MRKKTRDFIDGLDRFNTRRNWRVLGILYLTVLLPLSVAGFVVIVLSN